MSHTPQTSPKAILSSNCPTPANATSRHTNPLPCSPPIPSQDLPCSPPALPRHSQTPNPLQGTPQSHPNSHMVPPNPRTLQGRLPQPGELCPQAVASCPGASPLRRQLGDRGTWPSQCHTTGTSRDLRGDPQSPKCHTRGTRSPPGCHTMDIPGIPGPCALQQLCGDTGVARGSPGNRPRGCLEGPGALTCVQMCCRLGQVLAGFWGSHLGTDVVQTKQGEFGVGYLGRGVHGGCLTWAQTWCRPGRGVLGAFWGSHLGTDAMQFGGETSRGLGGFYLDTDPHRRGVPGEVLGGSHLGTHMVQATGGVEGSWGGRGGSHLCTDPVQPRGDGTGWPLAAEHVALQHLRQGVPSHVCKIPSGEEGGTLGTTLGLSPPSLGRDWGHWGSGGGLGPYLSLCPRQHSETEQR